VVSGCLVGRPIEQYLFLVQIHRFHGAEQARPVARFVETECCLLECPHVFGKAGAAVAAAGIDELIADPGIGADTDANVLDVRAHRIGDVRQFVHKADFCCQHGVRRVLGQFGGAYVHYKESVVVAVERCVEHSQQFSRTRIVGAHDDAFGAHEIFDGCALLEKFRVGYHVEFH